jgi:hypothetical protein
VPIWFLQTAQLCKRPVHLVHVQSAAPAKREAVSGLKHLSEAARVRATDKKASKFEKVRQPAACTQHPQRGALRPTLARPQDKSCACRAAVLHDARTLLRLVRMTQQQS